ncbi:hypothetical protein FACS1894105_01540 [Clostridia bacterium]|nr:hypothetical protein FACS1894105_01450 [Clostridia bacterium]GHU34554.1 hypothetical protein FACS1894105_01540 [Clostridia bacterium]
MLELLKSNAISIDEAEDYFFNHYTVEYLKLFNVDKKRFELIIKSCELENIVRLMPEKLYDVICKYQNEALKMVEKLPHISTVGKYWVD